jgi:hypothetical protein
MPIKVYLEDLIEGIEMQGELIKAFLNKETGKVVSVTEEDFYYVEMEDEMEGEMNSEADWQQEQIEIARKIRETDDYIQLPDEDEIDEYQIMKNFCLSLSDNKIRDEMLQSIQGSGAFERFKGNIRRFGITEEWYAYRDTAIKEITIEWCEVNDVEYVDA